VDGEVTESKFVTPANAGVQAVKRILLGRFKPWIPASAGMTGYLSGGKKK
jgi:hypothetical protein